MKSFSSATCPKISKFISQVVRTNHGGPHSARGWRGHLPETHLSVLPRQPASGEQARLEPFYNVRNFLGLKAAKMSEEFMADVVVETFCIFRQPLIKTLCMSQGPNHMLPLEGCQKGRKSIGLLKAAPLVFICDGVWGPGRDTAISHYKII